MSLNQGAFANASKLSRKELGLLARKAEEVRGELGTLGAALSGLDTKISLQDRGGKGDAYEAGNIIAIKYVRAETVDDEKFAADLDRMLGLLKLLYSSSGTASDHKAAYLLTWNPAKSSWSNLPDAVANLRKGVQPADRGARWSVINHGIKAADRLFLVRVGSEPKGIIGSGKAISSVY